jgi:hypothetical protein
LTQLLGLDDPSYFTTAQNWQMTEARRILNAGDQLVVAETAQKRAQLRREAVQAAARSSRLTTSGGGEGGGGGASTGGGGAVVAAGGAALNGRHLHASQPQATHAWQALVQQ